VADQSVAVPEDGRLVVGVAHDGPRATRGRLLATVVVKSFAELGGDADDEGLAVGVVVVGLVEVVVGTEVVGTAERDDVEDVDVLAVVVDVVVVDVVVGPVVVEAGEVVGLVPGAVVVVDPPLGPVEALFAPVSAWTTVPAPLTGCSPSQVSIRDLAIGAASVPPWVCTPLPWFNRTTATAIVGWAAGAKAANQSSVLGGLVPVWEVPVFPATSTPGIAAATPVPLGLLTTDSIRVVTFAAVAADVARLQTLSVYRLTILPWESVT
jgi:hypothetical protein